MIKDVVDYAESREEVLEMFESNLGNEALGLVNILWAQKREGRIK